MDRLSKQSKDVKKSSKVKETKQCETSEQRCHRYTRFFKTAGVATLLATTGMRGVESRQLQEPESALLEQKNGTRPEFDPSRVPPGFTDYLRNMKLPENTIRNVERRVLSEQRRKLKAVVNQPDCLDISASQVVGSTVSSMADTGLPGTMTRVDYYLNVKNGCSEPVDNVVYEITQSSTCPPPSDNPSSSRDYTYEGNPHLVGVGENSGMQGPRYASSACQNRINDVPFSVSPPDSLTVTVKAMGEVPGSTPGTVTIIESVTEEFKVI